MSAAERAVLDEWVEPPAPPAPVGPRSGRRPLGTGGGVDASRDVLDTRTGHP
ncbi:hypothetical protein [Streptomyces sp. NPDC059122]|uniref:hypothetical protein n=1 Tax=Streptomyces sp. NPDC059122 TaxID=3346732 RepID=UPI00369DD4D3